MLGKLLKHEFWATARFMWVIYGAMLLLSFGGYAGLHTFNDAEGAYLSVVSAVLIILWVMSMVVGVCLTIGLLVHRFYKNLLTDEGYLMFTLPVSAHQLVLSKMIVAAFWFLVTIGVVVLCALIGSFQSYFLRNLGMALENMTARMAMDGTVMLLELLVVIFLGSCAAALEFYSAMSIGYGFVNHKTLWSVVSFFGIQIILQFLGSFLLVGVTDSGLLNWVITIDISSMEQWHLSMLGAGLSELIFGLIFYCITVWNLKKRLNLA
jgi:hypothetical protein